MERNADIRRGDIAIDVRWKQLAEGEFIEVDRAQQTLWLNSDYRQAILCGGNGGLNDAPLLKTALFLLYHELFDGTYMGPTDKDKLILWGEVLAAAAEIELKQHGE